MDKAQIAYLISLPGTKAAVTGKKILQQCEHRDVCYFTDALFVLGSLWR